MTATAATFLTGCVHPVPAAYTAPSVTPVASAVAGTRCEIANTRTAIAKAEKLSKSAALDLSAEDRQQLQAAFAQADEYAQRAEESAILAQTNLVSFNAAVTNQTATLNTTTARLDYLQPKYEKAVGLVWKWRLIALAVIGGIVGFLAVKYGSRLAATAATVAAKIP